jgi:hypothetical protein
LLKLEDLKLGQRVKDAITHVEGVITARCDHISGYTQFAIQPPVTKEGTLPDAPAIDWQAFEILDDNLAANATSPEEHPLKLGDKVRSIDTGAVGTVVRFWTYFNGCVHAALTLPLNTKKEPQDALVAPVNRLELVLETTAKPKVSRTSGPPTRSPRL